MLQRQLQAIRRSGNEATRCLKQSAYENSVQAHKTNLFGLSTPYQPRLKAPYAPSSTMAFLVGDSHMRARYFYYRT